MFKERYERKLRLNGPDHHGTKRMKRQMEAEQAEQAIRQTRVIITGLTQAGTKSSDKTTEASPESTTKPESPSSED
tara:strand:- start:371 stop:598 length:228 start_codon:yes stop_codon:yes gene_type:complete